MSCLALLGATPHLPGGTQALAVDAGSEQIPGGIRPDGFTLFAEMLLG
jgi:hypothetical protein